MPSPLSTQPPEPVLALLPRLAYFFSQFPTLTTTFMQLQVRATMDLGLNCLLVANTPSGPGQHHPGDLDLLHRTYYLTPVRPALYLRANLAALRRWPQGYRAALHLAATLRGPEGQPMATNLAHLAGAAVLARYLHQRGVRHVHVHFAYGAAAVALFLHALADIPYSLSIHGSDVLLPNPLLEAKLRRARFVVSNCQYHIDQLRGRFPALAGQKFYVIRGGLDLKAGPFGVVAPPPPAPPLRLLTIGRLVPVKAQDFLIQACARLRDQGVDYLCHIVGDGPLETALRDLIARLGLQDRVQLLGARFQDEIAALYRQCHVFVLSSRSEGTPMVVMEAMAAGRPVVAPRITALPEMISPGDTGFLYQPEDFADLADKVNMLARDPALRQRLGQQAREQAAARFALQPNAARLLDVFVREIPAA